MNIEDLTIKQARELSALFGGGASASHSLKIGTTYLIRTVTYHFIGKLRSVTDSDIVFDDACWLADSGRFAEALATGKVSECEAVPDGHIVGRAGIIDAAVWLHPTPKTV